MLETLGGLLVGTVISGIVPIVNAELLVVAAAAVAPASLLPLIVLVSTVGQMLTKTLLFGIAKSTPSRLPERARVKLDKASASLRERGGAAKSLVFASAAVGLPPFYGISLASGALGMGWKAFIVSGTTGRFCRFAVLAWLANKVGGEALDAVAFAISASPLVRG